MIITKIGTGFINMPIHNYKCRKCKHEFEVFYRSHSERDETESKEKCPKCGSLKKIKKVSNSSFQLKGNGWFNKGGY